MPLAVPDPEGRPRGPTSAAASELSNTDPSQPRVDSFFVQTASGIYAPFVLENQIQSTTYPEYLLSH